MTRSPPKRPARWLERTSATCAGAGARRAGFLLALALAGAFHVDGLARGQNAAQEPPRTEPALPDPSGETPIVLSIEVQAARLRRRF